MLVLSQAGPLSWEHVELWSTCVLKETVKVDLLKRKCEQWRKDHLAPEGENPEQVMLNIFLLTLLTSGGLALLLPLSWRDTSLTGYAHLCLSSLQWVFVPCNRKYVTQPSPDHIPPSSSLFSVSWVSVIFKEKGLSHVPIGVTVVWSWK